MNTATDQDTAEIKGLLSSRRNEPKWSDFNI